LARVIQEHIKKPLAEEILFGALKDGGIVRVLVTGEGADKALAFEYLKPDTPIRPRDPEDVEPEDEGGESAPKPKAKRPAKRAKGASAKKATSSVPKVPLGSR
jgi:ATP-dependent Clp protease ATP-binding subunit ClpA